MLEELRWKTSLSATALHAAWCRAQALPAGDAELARLLNPASDQLLAEIEAASWPVDELLAQLTSFAAEFDGNRELVERAVARLHLPPHDPALVTRIVGAIGALEGALLRAQPNLAEELAMRCRPLREQWEARGPGMMREIARLTEAAATPSAAEIVLVSPFAGGHGLAHIRENRVTLEGVLFHPYPALPETVRLAWLVAQLNADLPRYAELLTTRQAPIVFAAAMLVPTLSAAQEMELGACDLDALATACATWEIAAKLPPDAPQRIWDWWSAWLEQGASWPVAVVALERMLA